MARAAWLANTVLSGAVGRASLQWLGLVDTPRLSGVDLRRELAARGLSLATPEALRALGEAERRRAVVLVQDAFTSHYETQLVLDVLDLLRRLGFTPWLAPFQPNGKALHVHGFLGAFGRVAAANAAGLRALAETGVELIGIDPSMTLTYRAEYAEALGGRNLPKVLLLQEWLAKQAVDGPSAEPARYRLLPHCTERTTATASLRDWQSVFARHGLQLDILAAGCCGMAGTYGHEAEHRDTSEQIYGLSWRRHLAADEPAGRLLATGYSCRSQVKRFDGVVLMHPAQALLRALPKATPRP
jgi:Fe-S oxidoreductase